MPGEKMRLIREKERARIAKIEATGVSYFYEPDYHMMLQKIDKAISLQKDVDQLLSEIGSGGLHENGCFFDEADENFENLINNNQRLFSNIINDLKRLKTNIEKNKRT